MKNYNLRLFSLILLCSMGLVPGVQSCADKPVEELESTLRSLPWELQKSILLSNEALTFLSQQPLVTCGGPDGHTGIIQSVALNNDIIVTGSNNVVKLWNKANGQLLHTLEGRKLTGSIFLVEIRGDKVITKSLKEGIKLWDTTGKFLYNLEGSCCHYILVALSDDKIAGIPDKEPKKTRIWDIHTGKLVRELEHSAPCSSVALSDNTVAIGFYDKKVELWDIAKGERLHSFELEGQVLAVALQGALLAIGSVDESTGLWTVKIMNGKTGTVLTLGGNKSHDGSISTITLQGNRIATRAYDCLTKTWDIFTGDLLLTMKTSHVHQFATLSGDREIVIDQGAAVLGDIKTGTAVRSFSGPNGHTQQVNAVAVYGNELVTVSDDKTAKVWPLAVNLQLPPEDTPLLPEDNPFLWIIKEASVAQLSFIQRAYKATIANQEFIIAMPKGLSTIEESESQEQADGRVYFSFHPAVRTYLRNRLTIRRVPSLTEKITNFLNTLEYPWDSTRASFQYNNIWA